MAMIAMTSCRSMSLAADFSFSPLQQPLPSSSRQCDMYLEKDEPVIVQPSLEDLLRPETEEGDALSLADFDDGSHYVSC